MLSFWNHEQNHHQKIRSLKRRRDAQVRRNKGIVTAVERLEDRALLSTFTVTNVSDNPATAGSLRNVINQANANPDVDDIVFSSFFSTPRTITLTGGQLAITKSVNITGPGAANLTINANQLSRVFNVDDGTASLLTVRLSNMTVTNGKLTDFGNNGAGIASTENLTVSGMVISGNQTAGLGGGIYFNSTTSGSLTVQDSTISGNTGSFGGGGIATETLGSGHTLIQYSTIANNSTPFGGGGIYSRNSGTATTTIVNSTVTGNTALCGGGVYANSSGGTTSIQACTISGNTATGPTSYGGGVYVRQITGTVSIQNSILALNTAGNNGPDLDVISGTASVKTSLIGKNPGSNLAVAPGGDANGNLVGSAATPVNPQLDTLKSNGGPTQTLALLANSPAIGKGGDAGSPGAPGFDQRGFARPNSGKIDMGAFQTQTAPAAPANLVLAAASDTGALNSDRITNDTTPTITGTSDPSVTIELFDQIGAQAPFTFVSLGTTTATGGGTWSVTATTLGNGAHTLVAVATNSSNIPSDTPSIPLIITVDTTAPSAPTGLVLFSADDSGVSGDRITKFSQPRFSGSAEPNSTVQLQVDGLSNAMGVADGAGNWTISLLALLTEGGHTIQAFATDVAGNPSAGSSTLSITIDSTAPAAPVITGLDPASDSGTLGDGHTNATTPTFNGTAEPGSTVTLKDGSTTVGTGTANSGGNWSITISTPLNPGVHSITAVATDVAANTGAVSGAFSLTIDAIDNTPPAKPTNLALAPVSNSGATNDLLTNDTTPTITGIAEALSTVKLFEGGTLLGTVAADGSGNWSITATVLANGPHNLTVTATDASNNTSVLSDVLTVTIDNTSPAAPTGLTLALASNSGATNDLITSDNTPTITGTAEPNSSVQLKEGGTALGTATADGTGNWSITTPTLGSGTHTLTAIATDLAGNVGATSSGLTVTIDTTAPAAPQGLTLAAASNSGATNDTVTNDVTPTITGTAEIGSTVTLTADDLGLVLGTAITDGSGNWSITPLAAQSLPELAHALSATATDIAGNISAASSNLIVIIDTIAPGAPTNLTLDPSSDTGAQGDFVTTDDTPTINGTASPGVLVTLKEGVTVLGTVAADVAGNWIITSVSLGAGSHTLTATATDGAANISQVSSALGLTINTPDTTPPIQPTILGLTTNTDSGNLGDGITTFNAPTITGIAEVGSTVRLKEGNTLLGTVTAVDGSWSITLGTLGDGTHPLTVTATDAANNTSVLSNVFTLRIDTVTPNSPANLAISDATDSGTKLDGITNVTQPVITGTAEAGTTVTLFENGSTLGTAVADLSGNWSIPVNTALASGQHNLQATATDDAGNVSVISLSLNITIDTTAPGKPLGLTLDPASDTGRANDGMTKDSTPTINGTAEPRSVVTLKEGGVNLGSATTDVLGNWSVTSANLALGSHTLTAVTRDAAGNQSVLSDSMTLTIDNDSTPPAAPTNVRLAAGFDTGVSTTDGITSRNPVRITGFAEPGSSVLVLFNNTAFSNPVTVASDGTWTSEDNLLLDQVFTVLAFAVDAELNTSPNSASIQITIDTTAPAKPGVPVLDPGSDAGTKNDGRTNIRTPKLNGTADAGSVVMVKDGGTVLSTVTADPSGKWTFTPSSNLSFGTHTFTASAADAAGNVSADSDVLTIQIVNDFTPPGKPTGLALAAGDDSGSSSTDGITNKNFLGFTGNAEAGSFVILFFSADNGSTFTPFPDTVIVTAPDGTWPQSVIFRITQNGSYLVKAQATDALGNVGPFSDPFQFTLDTTTPVITNFNVVVNSVGLATVTGTTEPGNTVTVDFADGQSNNTIAGPDGRFTATHAYNVASPGTKTLLAIAADVAGNFGTSVTQTVTISATGDNVPNGTATPASIFKAPARDNSTFVVDVDPNLDKFLTAGSYNVNLSIDRFFGDFALLRTAKLLPDFVTLSIPAFDVDSSGQTPEVDRISVNGTQITGQLTGLNETWKMNTFSIPIGLLNLPADPNAGGPDVNLPHPQRTLVPANNTISFNIDVNHVGYKTSIDWVSLRIEAPNPVFLVNGALNKKEDWDVPWEDGLENDSENKLPKGFGMPVFWVDLDPGSNTPFDTIANNAAKIKTAVTKMQQEWGFRNITIVGQFTGGLAARQFVSDLMKDQDSSNDQLVSTLIEIGVPNAGIIPVNVAASDFLDASKGLGGAFASDFQKVLGAQDLSPDAMATFNLAHPDNPNTTYWGLASVYDAPSSDLLGKFLADQSPGVNDDSLVTVTSAWTGIDPARQFSYRSATGDASSVKRGNISPGQIMSQGIYNLLLPIALRSNLQAKAPFSGPRQVGGSPTAPLVAAGPPVTPQNQPLSVELPSSMPSTAVIDGLAVFGFDTTHQVFLEAGQPAYVSLVYVSGQIDLTFTSPSGVTVKPTDPGFDFEETRVGAVFTIYKFTAPQGGMWSFKVHNAKLVPQPYIINGWFPNSTLAMTAAVDRPGYALGDSIVVSAHIKDGATNVTGATVNAQVFDTNFAPHDLPLFDDGSSDHGDDVANDGVYSNVYSNTNSPGVYNIVVEATGSGSKAFSRQAATLAAVAEATASLTDTFTDSVVDLDENGLSDQLVIQAGIAVTSPGRFTVLGELRDANDRLLGLGFFSGDLTPEDQQVSLVFDGRPIFDNGTDGPYHLTNVRLVQESAAQAVLIQQIESTYQTAAYNHQIFEHGSIAILGISSEDPVVGSVPGKFDLLNLDVEVTVATAGVYDYSAALVDALGNLLGTFTGSSSLNEGVNTISFSFDGAAIGANRVNGPFRLTDLVIGSDTDGAVVSQQFTTLDYLASQFEGFAPTVPTNLDLTTASDTGRFSNDNFTGDTTPTLTVSADPGPGTTVVFHVNGSDVTANETSPGVYTATLAAGIVHEGSNSITATATNSAGTSLDSTPLVIQLATPQTSTITAGGSLVVTQPDGKVVTIQIQGALSSATVTMLSNNQVGEINGITYTIPKKLKGAQLLVSATGGQGVVDSITSNTGTLTTLTLTNIKVGHIQVNGSLGTVTFAGSSTFTNGLTVTANAVAIQATNLSLSSTINVTGNLTTARFAGAVAGSAITVAKTLKTLEFNGNSNVNLNGKKITTINSKGTMDGTYRVTSISTINSTGVFHVSLGTTKVSHKNFPPG